MFDSGPAGVVIAIAAAVAVLTLVIRQFGAPGRRMGGGTALGALGLSAILGALSLGANVAGVPTLPLWLQLGAAVGLIVGVVGLWGMILFDVVLARFGVDVPSIMRDLLQALVASVLALGFLRLAGIDLLPLLTTSAVLTAVIGLALQTTIANLFAGVALQVDRTLRAGDWIHVGNHIGRIEEIGWRSTRIVTKDGDTVFVPNGGLVSGEVLNFSRPTSHHRVWVKVGFHYRHQPNVVRRTLLDAMHGVDGVLHDPPPDCIVIDFADSAVTYGLRYWINRYDRDTIIDSEVRSRIWYAARRAGLEIPFPIRTLIRADEAVSEAGAVLSANRERLLAGVHLFAKLEEPARRRLAEGMRRAEFGAGETIIRQGEVGDSLFLIEHGEIEVVLGVEGATGELAVLGAGDVFGEMSLMTGDRRTATCIARTDVTCWILEKSTLQPVLAEQPALAEQLSAVLTERYVEQTAARDDLFATARKQPHEHQQYLLARVRAFFSLG